MMNRNEELTKQMAFKSKRISRVRPSSGTSANVNGLTGIELFLTISIVHFLILNNV
jgi:hypothetical protein